MVKIKIKILPKESILDREGRALKKILEARGLDLENCSYGKYIELSFSGNDLKQAEEQAKKITETLLHNPLMEKFELEIKGN